MNSGMPLSDPYKLDSVVQPQAGPIAAQSSEIAPGPSSDSPRVAPTPDMFTRGEEFSAVFVQLAQMIGVGLVELDEYRRAAPLNEAGAILLKAIGATPNLTPELAYAAATATNENPASSQIVTPSPESRHLVVTVLRMGERRLVALRDETADRLLHERLLQSEKMASVGQLVSGVAHELNNPLTGVMGFAQLLLARDLDDTVRTQVQTIYGEAERAAKVVQNLLSFARRRKPAKEMADINALVQRVLELRSYDFVIRNISLDLTLDSRMPRVWADPDQIQQVLFNVTKNAEQAMVEAHNGGRLTVITQATPTGVRVSIADDGPGMPPEIQRRIFDPFFTTKEAGEGTGLGLTICYSIIEEHGGRIWTENRPAGGSVFYIDLPLGVAEVREVKPAEGSNFEQAPRIGSRRILIVDDEESIRLLLHDILRMDQHEVQIARSGIEAAEILEKETFDVIITDYKMPGMDGASFYRHVRQKDPELARRIIFITGDTVSPETRAFLQRVDNTVLSKPFKIGPLRDAIEALLGGPSRQAVSPEA